MDQHMTASSSYYLSGLLFSYKEGNKIQYDKYLEKLKPFLDDQLYDFFFNFGKNSLFLKKGKF